MATVPLIPPYPYFGGKRTIAPLIWDALGDVQVYIEPFLGSASVLLARPHPAKIETVNDKGCFIANFWRAIQQAPDEVAAWADSPVLEADLHARHRWLVTQEDFLTRMRMDPDYYDAKLAGWWVWGQCAWIGNGWCDEQRSLRQQTPDITGKQWAARPQAQGQKHGDGIHGLWQQVPRIGADQYGNGIHGLPQKRPQVHGRRSRNGTAGSAHISDWFAALAERLRRVRVCCGDWQRVCTPVVLDGCGVTGIYLDPPYSHQERDPRLYSTDEDVAAAVAAWAQAHGDHPRYRLVLSGYAGEHEMRGWRCISWKANGGYGNQGTGRGKANAPRECLWLSPHCVEQQLPLFGEVYG